MKTETLSPPPPTHAEFAARISTHREAVTKTLSALEREVSGKRRALHDVLHTLEMELAERIQAARP